MNNQEQSVRRIYEFFADICKIPHPSFHCEQIRKYIEHTAMIHGLEYREDAAGNVRLDRKNSIYSQAIALQAHMDMVPQSSDPDFDFTVQPIEIETVNGILQSKNQKTTLGADNGIGMATALTAMIDEDLKDIPLCAIFTVDEESGMHGAKNIDQAFLECKAIINLDSETWGDIIIGCAGGMRLESKIPMQQQPLPANCRFGVKVSCKGLKGGHSGVDIHLNRGNAILIMLDFISESCAKVSTIKGGTLPNAIPRSAEFTGAVSDFERFKKFAEEYSLKIRKEFDTFDDFAIEVELLDRPPEYCIENFGHTALFLKSTRYGVVAENECRGCVATSNNFATLRGDTNSLDLLISIRSISNIDRANLTRTMAEHYAKIGGENIITEGCPVWESTTSADFLNMLSDTFRELFDRECEIKYIHAGLECGYFQSKTENIPIVSFGPTIHNPHSPSERFELATLKDFYEFLSKVLQNILKK